MNAYTYSRRTSSVTGFGDSIPGKWSACGLRTALSSPAMSQLFDQPFIQEQIKGNVKAPRQWPLCLEFTCDRQIPRTNGQ